MDGDRGTSAGDTIRGVRSNQRRNHLTSHEIHYPDGSVAGVEHLGRPYRRGGSGFPDF